jgi:serine/threonine protein kinase
MELCDEDLENVLNKRERGFTEEEVRILLKQLNNVFAIMEKENIIHRDLKLKNIMVVYNKLNEINLLTDQNIQKHSLNFTAKLSDFGFSKIMEDDSTFSRVGTPITMAPEVLKNEKYTIKADLWSIGIITYQLLFKTLPEGRNAMQRSDNILKGIKIPDGYTISEDLFDLLKNLLHVDAKKRLSWQEYFNHPFFNKDKTKIN